MGSICSGRLSTESPTSRKSTQITSKNDIHFSQRKFVQENNQQFYSVYSLATTPSGSGAFGTVFICTHKRTNDQRAVKVLSKAYFTEEETLSRSVFDEVEILKTLDHPNIVKVFEYFEDDCNYYIVMELINGGDLFDIVSKSGKLTEDKAIETMRKLLLGINYLHSRNVIHRDLKPENVLVVPLENHEKFDIKIIDFNVSALKHDAKHVERAGTLDYMSPEALLGDFDEKTDMWSCGVILYMMVTGYLPFGGASDEEIEKAISKGNFSFPTELFDDISEDCKDLICKLLEKDPKIRLTAAQALEHSWLYQPCEASCDYSMLTETLNSIKEPKNVSKLREVITTIMISQLGKSKETKKLEKFFSAIDTNRDGVITAEELVALLSTRMPKKDAEEQAGRIMKVLDIDGNGCIDFSEFLRISVEEENLLTKENLKRTFDYLDRNGSSGIEKEDLKEWLNNSDTISDSIIVDLMEEADKDRDGKINYKEFEELLVDKLDLFR